MANAYARCVGSRLRGRHFKNRTTAKKAMKAAARACKGKTRRRRRRR